MKFKRILIYTSNLTDKEEMKKFNYIIGLLTILAIYGCKKEWEAPGVEPNHQVIYTSEYQFGNRVQVGGSMTFTDASKGIVSRKWSLPEGATVEGTSDTTSTTDLVHVQFNEAGLKEVNLSQSFAGAAFDGNAQRESEMDTTILINVVDSLKLIVKANFYFPDGTVGEELDLTKSNDVQAGRMIKYTLTAIGEPSRVVYNFGGGDPDQVTYIEAEIEDGTAAETIVQYKQLGTFSTSVLGNRARPGGIDTLNFVNAINVIPSADPLILTDVYVKNGFVALDYSREIEPASVDASTFSVKITNGADELTPSILTASVDPSAKNIVLIALDGETVYDDDVVMVSYQGGILQSTDFGPAEEFVDRLLVHRPSANVLESSLFDYSFETSIADDWPYLNWGAQWEKYTLDMVDTEAYHGGKSARLEMESGGGAIFSHNQNFTMEAGKSYELGMMIKVESGVANINDAATEVPSMLVYFGNPTIDWAADRFNFTTQTVVGDWIYARCTFYSPKGSGDYRLVFRPFNPETANPDPLVLYMDNISLREVNLRP